MKKIIIKVDCGDFHSAALTSNNWKTKWNKKIYWKFKDLGELFTWGGGGSNFNKG